MTKGICDTFVKIPSIDTKLFLNLADACHFLFSYMGYFSKYLKYIGY